MLVPPHWNSTSLPPEQSQAAYAGDDQKQLAVLNSNHVMMYVVVLRTRTRRVVHLLPIPDLFLGKVPRWLFWRLFVIVELTSWTLCAFALLYRTCFARNRDFYYWSTYRREDRSLFVFGNKVLEISPVPLSDTKGWEHNSYYSPSESRGGTNVCQGSGAALQRGCRRLIQGRDVEGHGSPRGGRVYS